MFQMPDQNATFTFQEMAEAIANITDAVMKAIDDNVEDEQVKIKIALDVATNVYRQNLLKAAEIAQAEYEEQKAAADELTRLFSDDDLVNEELIKKLLDGFN